MEGYKLGDFCKGLTLNVPVLLMTIEIILMPAFSVPCVRRDCLSGP